MSKAYELCACHAIQPGEALCPKCEGSRWFVIGVNPLRAEVCPTCSGTGYVTCPHCGRMSGPECAPGVIGMEES